MFNRSSLLVSLFLISSTIAYQPHINAQEPSELYKWGSLTASYLKQLPSLAISASIGALTGGACAHIFKTAFDPKMAWTAPLIYAWCIEIIMREAAINQIDRDLSEQRIQHNRRYMFATALIASWLAYLKIGHDWSPTNQWPFI